MLSVGFNKFNAVNFQGNSFRSREKSNLNLRTQPDAVCFKQNERQIASSIINHRQIVENLNNFASNFGLDKLFIDTKILVSGKARNCTENIVEGLINVHKENDIPVNWTNLAESVKKTFENAKEEWPEGSKFCDEISKCVDVVVGERHIGALQEELETATTKLQKDIENYTFKKYGFFLPER